MAAGLWGRMRRLVERRGGCTLEELCEQIIDSPAEIRSAAWAMCKIGVLDFCSFSKDSNRGDDAGRNYSGPGYFVLKVPSNVVPIRRPNVVATRRPA
jgi:hypothetical protein